MSALAEAVRAELGLAEGYLLPWSIVGCQVVNPYRAEQLMSCPVREGIHRCEVIGPHTRHRWSWHTIAHERAGNGYGCRFVGDEDSARRLMTRVYPWSRVGASR